MWKDIPDYMGLYQVSNLGNIKSLDREVYNEGNKTICKVKGKILKPSFDRNGYCYVGLVKNKVKTNSLKVHRLVGFAFCNGYEIGKEINHKDGIRHNNEAKNLEWVNRSQNIRDTFKRGRNVNGEKNNSSKLKDEYVGIIASLYDSGVSQSIVALAFGVSQAAISNIITNKSFKNGLIDQGLAIDINNL